MLSRKLRQQTMAVSARSLSGAGSAEPAEPVPRGGWSRAARPLDRYTCRSDGLMIRSQDFEPKRECHMHLHWLAGRSDGLIIRPQD